MAITGWHIFLYQATNFLYQLIPVQTEQMDLAITPEFYRTWVKANAPLDPAAADPTFL